MRVAPQKGAPFVKRMDVRKLAFYGALVTSEPHRHAAEADYH